MTPPLAFSDEQVAELVDIAKALPMDQRSDFLLGVVARLRPPFSTDDVRSSTIAAVRAVSGAGAML